MYYSDEQTERELARLEKSIKREYTQAYKELKKKTDDYFANFAVRDARMKADIESGKYPIPAGYTPDQYYKIWRQNQLGRGKRWEKMRDDMAKRIGKSNQIAASYINDTTPGIYSLNHNYEAYQIESITGAAFDIYNEQTVKQLVKGENHTEFRTVSVNPVRDYKWNTKKINTALTSGILQGKSIKNLTDSFMEVMQNNRKAAIRNARTAVTSAQNSGRQECYNRAVEKGIELEKEWMATNDSRTRDSHKHLDGVIVKYNEPFPNGLMYPGDPDGEPAEVYNCFVEDTAVTADSEVIRSYKHKYDGELITVKTACGVQFTCTPNHPILTPNGWIAAKRFNDGDDIVIAVGCNHHLPRVNPNINHGFATFDTVHKLFAIFFGEGRCGLSVNFHGDIATANVEIITKKRFLGKSLDSIADKKIIKLFLKSANTTAESMSAFVKHTWGIVTSTLCNICSKSILLSFFRSHIAHSDIHSVGTSAKRDTIFTQDSVDDISAETIFSGETFSRLPVDVFTDKVVSVERSIASCHVYNLQTGNNYYYVNGIHGNEGSVMYYAIAHNCRCTMTARLPKYSDYSLAKGSRTGNDAASYKKWVNDKKNTEKSSEKNEKNSIIIAKSLGAKARNYDVSMPDGSITHFTEGTRIENIKTIAGKGRNRQIDMVDVLVDNYGGSASEWQKKKGLAYIDLEDESIKCEVHWYEEPTAGRHDFKVKPHNGEIEYHE